MVLKHVTRETEKIIETRRQKNQAKKAELNNLKNALGKKNKKDDAEFNRGFAMALILLCRSYEPLHEHAFAIFQEAGYELNEFNRTKLDPSDRKTLHKIFSL